MSKFQFDIPPERLPLDIKDGDDVTHHFKDDLWSPDGARVLMASGGVGGNPFIEFSWRDDARARAWAIQYGIIDMEMDGGEEYLELFRA
jgi:hypothetical protein